MLYSWCLEIIILSLNLNFVKAIQWDNGTCAQDWEPQLLQNPTSHHFPASQDWFWLPNPFSLVSQAPLASHSCPWHMTTDAFHQGNDQIRWQGWQWESYILPWPSTSPSKSWAGLASAALWQMIGGDVGGRAMPCSRSCLIQVPGMSQNSSCHPLGLPIHHGVGSWGAESDFPSPSQDRASR